MTWTKEEKSEYAKAYRLKNIEKIKARDAKYQPKYRAENLEKIKVKNAKYRAENLEKIKAKSAEYLEGLKDPYIKSLLKSEGFTKEDITDNPILIETKRIILKTKRL